MLSPKFGMCLLALVCTCGTAALGADGGDAVGIGLTPEQIVIAMEHQNQLRSAELRHYKALRHYEVSYKGFGTGLEAKMEVEISFDAPAAQDFRIVSQSGSKLLIDKVLKRLLDT